MSLHRFSRRLIALLCGALFAATAVSTAAAAPVRTPQVEAELVAASTALVPGQPVQAALRLKMIPGWHTYWRNPGDSGEPTELHWKLPKGYSAGEILWPAPIRLPVGPLMNYGYEGEILLPVEIAVPKNATGSALPQAASSMVVVAA